MCMVEGCDPATFYSERVRVAKKEHRCDECRRTIAVGERYQYVSGLWDGHFETNKTCQHCTVPQAWLLRECSGWMFGAVEEDIVEHVLGAGRPFSADGYGSWPARYVVGMRRDWRRFDGAGFLPVPPLSEISAHG